MGLAIRLPLFLFALAAPVFEGRSADASPTPAAVLRAPPPAWVAAVPVPAAPVQSDGGGVDHLLVDEQYHAGERVYYGHFARRFRNQQGVQESARIAIDFDPTYQTLTLHQLVVHRNGESQDRLPTQPVRTLQRETSMESHLYDGYVTASLDPEDVRPGDVLEYAFSIRGENPVFGDRISVLRSTTWSEPTAMFQFRLVHPRDAPRLARKTLKAPLEYEEVEHAGYTERRWWRRDVPAVRLDGDAPEWFRPWGQLQLSSYDGWGAVVDWALGFYAVPEALPPAIDAEIERLRGLPDEEARILGALDYVQNNLRYLSVSSGVHSHQPYPIEEVVRRGFGDCKDKARLLVAMLRRLGFDAWPALVATELRQTIDAWLPTPRAFDHVIVALRWRDRPFWLDPTIDHQGGRLGQRFVPAFGKALVIREGERALSNVTPAGAREAQTSTLSTYRLPTFHGPVALEIRTEWRGREADWMRGHRDRTPAAEIAQRWLNYTAEQHPGAEATSPPAFRDDSERNVITAEESYRIPDFWRAGNEKDGRRYAELFAASILSSVREPAASVRTDPLAVTHPRTVRERIVVHMPAGNFSNEDFSVEDEAFRYQRTVRLQGSMLTIEHLYQSLADAVEPERVPEYLRRLRDVREALGYSLTLPEHLANPSGAGGFSPADVNWTLLLVVLVGLGLGAGLFLVLLLWRPRWPPRPAHPRLHGLRGWLILLGLGVVLRPVFQLITLGELAPLLTASHWAAFTQPGGAYHHWLWQPLFLANAFLVIPLLFAEAAAVVLFFTKRRTFPPVQIAVLAFLAVFVSIETALAVPLAAQFPDLDAGGSKEMIQTLVGAAIWIPYLLISQRVRATFVK